MTKAKWQHDCTKCILLAPRVTLGSRIYDFYVCPIEDDPRWDGMIARYSHVEEQYLSRVPHSTVITAVDGLLHGLWCEYHKVKRAGLGFVVINDKHIPL